MPALEFPRLENVLVDSEEFEAMRSDQSLLISMWFKDPLSEKLFVCFWNKDARIFPPWIRTAA